MNVLRLTPFFHHDSRTGWPARYDAVGGMQTQIRQASLWLAERGVRQTVVTFGMPDTPPRYTLHAALEVRTRRLLWPEIRSSTTGLVGLGLSWLVGAWRECRRLARDGFVPDLVHAHADGLLHPLLLAPMAARLWRAPYVLTLHCSRLAVHRPLSGVDRLQHGLVRAVERRVAGGAARVVTLTRRTAGILADAEGAAAGRIVVVPDAVEPRLFAREPAAAEVAAFRTRFRLGPGPVLAFVGRIAEEKGWPAMLDLAAILAARRPHLLFVGDGPQRPALAARLRRAGSAGRATITGFLPHAAVAVAYAAADVVVIPSRHEEFGSVQLEALASGRPVVAYGVGGIPETLGRLLPDLVVTPEHVPALARAVATVLDERQRSAARLAAARQVVVTEYGLDAVLPRLLGVYHDVLPGRGAPAAAVAAG